MSGQAILHPFDVLFGGGVGLSCALDGELRAEELHGLFAGDTRVLSTYRLAIGGHPWRLLARWRPGPSTAQWDMQNPCVRAPGGDIEEGTVHLRLRRRVSGALHDDLRVTGYVEHETPIRLTLQLDADFADLFEVKDRSTPPRLGVQHIPRPDGVCFSYRRRDFQRALHVTVKPSTGRMTIAGSRLVFDIVLRAHQAWHCCVHAIPELDGRPLEIDGAPHAAETPALSRVAVVADPLVSVPFERAALDLDRLAIREPGAPPFVAAGAPWFLALFGRDTLVTALMGGLLGSWHTRGALSALARLQAQTRDDFRDAEPGKLPHELRRGEHAHFGIVPHSPYYGTHDAPALYVLALWHAWRWTGDRSLLDAFLPTALEAMRWCEGGGDPDHDGLLEYQTRSPRGYLNQGWKDAGDAIPHEDGHHAEPPIATVELQGYLFAARLALAELLDASGMEREAARYRALAMDLRALVEDRFWMEDRDAYALALDGRKRPVRSIASNSGHLLWCGLSSRARAGRVARRLLAEDMFSGYGLRTLSARHRAYNPLSYQLGSVWPHDTALFVAGLVRYGFCDEAGLLLKALLDAAAAFEQARLPELFSGFQRSDGPPVPYEKANTPQAWAAAAPVLGVQLMLGLLPDAPRGRCYVNPWLPEWVPRLEVEGIEIGAGRLDVAIERTGSSAVIRHARHPSLEIVQGMPEAPLWGKPPLDEVRDAGAGRGLHERARLGM
jgi:glycogen debranching enzyme